MDKRRPQRRIRYIHYRMTGILSVILIMALGYHIAKAAELYESSIGSFTISVPEGYQCAGTLDNQDVFRGEDSSNFNISTTKDSGLYPVLLQVFADEMMDSIVEQYTSVGIPEDIIQKEEPVTTESNGLMWLGVSLNYYGMHMRQCATCTDVGTMYVITFTDMNEEEEKQILESFRQIDAQESGTADERPGDNEESSASDGNSTDSGKEYSLMEGRLKVTLSDDYDVYIKNVTEITQEMADHHGLDKERLELYLSMQGSDLLAVKKGELLGGRSDEIHIRIKPDSYTGIDNFNQLSGMEQNILADALVSGFNDAGDYELHHTEDMCFIVFETDLLGKQLRYATIVDEAMIYLYYKPIGELTDENRRTLRDVADTMRVGM